ncbi:MAG: class I SAM-dependent methyltransferase [Desulfomonilaceae bacterium]|nr:class I SAM-dependent methyltransferase [Desulfomonilaceae bacterium]
MTDRSLLDSPSPDVGHLYAFMADCSRKFKEFCVLSVAVEKGLFDVLEHQHGVEHVSDELGVQSSMTEDLCQILCDAGFLERTDNGYRNSDTSRVFLRKESHLFQGEVIKNLQYGFKLWEQLGHVWENGPLMMNPGEFFANNHFMSSLKAQILTGELQRTTAVVAGLPEFSEARRILDLGGGHGLYCVALCEGHPRIEGTVLDTPEMRPYAEAMFAKHSVANVRFREGDLFGDDFGRDYDIVLLYYNPAGKNAEVLRKIHQALKPGGLFINKHVFYASGERSKSRLLDVEWNLTAFQGAAKKRHIYWFAGDLSLEDYTALLQDRFEIVKIVETSDFAAPDLQAFGDRLDSKIVVAKKR